MYFQPEDMFVQTVENEDLEGPPPAKKLKKSQCTPLFMNAYTMAGMMLTFSEPSNQTNTYNIS